ncbi:TRAP transporter small permease [Rhodoligotrophos defluvii]|uniref:TRAP transporter small permease n=1 Tax=Rhodoligotrophos defluvii TaxID=2561934 RepID=UPI0014854870|nr:TRAP transporter small permease [Rhodoligotrophos defluvii]
MAQAERWLDRLIFLSLLAGSIGLALMMLHITVDVALRYFFRIALVGTIEIVSYYYMIAVVFLPLAFVERKSEHIEVELFVQYMPIKARNAFYIFGRVAAIVFFAMLAYQSWQDAIQYTRIGEEPMGLELPIWPSRWILPISFGLLVLALVLHTIKGIINFAAEKPQGDGPAFARDASPEEALVHE